MKKMLFILTAIAFVSSLYFVEPLLAGADEVKVITGKIIDVAPVYFVHPPRYAFCRIQVVADDGSRTGIFVPRATTITDLNGKDISGKWPGKGERVEIKYYTLKPGEDDRTYTASIRYVSSDYVQQPAVSKIPVKTASLPSAPTSTPTPGPSFQGAEIPSDKAIVYIYRPSPPGGLAGCVAADVGIPFSVKASGKAVTTLVQGGYYAYVTEPGSIEFTAIEDKYSGPLAAKSPFSITVDAKAGQAYYLKGMHRHGIVTELSLALISQEVGAKEIADCKLITTTLGSTSAPAPATQQAAATANAYGEKIFVGKIEYTSHLSLHIPPGRTLRLSSDKGDKLTVFVSNDIAIRDMKGYPTRIGEKAEVKYSSATNGENEVSSFRYVPLDYVQQSTAPVMSAKTTPSTQAPAQGSSFQLGETIPSDKAVVYIYRPAGSGAGGAAMPFGVKANGKVEITLVQGGYYAYVTEPSNAEFTTFEIGFMAPKSTSSVTVDAKAGQAYYLKGAHGKGAMGRARLESVSPEVGVQEIANCKLITTQ